MNSWYGQIASWDICVLMVFARIWPSVTDMQHYYHARYPTDDWHLAYMFSLVYFSVDVCLVGVFPHSVSTISLCQGLSTPHAGFPLHEKKIEQWWSGSALDPSEGPFELTHGSACIIGWQSRLLDILIPLILHSLWGVSLTGFIIALRSYSVIDIFLPTIIIIILECLHALKMCKFLWSLSCGGVPNMLLVLSITFHFH